eukprot:m.228164 g.228164  ORF g.228164 m.228164 type:complete len:387 (-) comp17414_c0_seq1:131-1291(-)
MAEGTFDGDSTGFPPGNFIGRIDDAFICLICQNVVEDPCECPCGHLFCNSHIMQWLERSRTCPSCREPVQADLKSGNALHLSYRRQLADMKIKCDYHSLGCSQVLHPSQLRAHVATCGFTPAFCRWEGCPYHARAKRSPATQFLNLKALPDHEKSCEFRTVICDLPGCNEMMQASKLPAHVRTCRTVLMDCLVKGCPARPARGAFRAHFEETAHVYLLAAEVSRLSAELDRPELVHDNTVVFKVADVLKKFEAPAFRFETKLYTLGVMGRLGYNFRVQLRKREWPEDRKKFNDRLGVYLHIEQGEIDDLLQWPFPYHYTFSILDQSPADKRHVEFAVTDGATRGADWLGPGTGKGWGPQGIASFETLRSRGYCHNDTMFVMIKFHR